MKIQKTDVDSLNTTISIEIEKADYLEKFEVDVKKYGGQSQLKGFRKGKTPVGVIKKMYGKSILAEAVNESLQKGLVDYIKENNLNVLGDPLPSESQEMLDFDVNNLNSFTFKFDLGLSPDIVVKGIAESDSYDLFNIEIKDDVVEEELSLALRKQGKQEEVTDSVEEKDMLRIKAIELENGLPKEGGWETDFTLMAELIAEDAMKAKVLKLKAGGAFDFDIYNLEKDKDENHVRKYLLNAGDDVETEIGKDFRGTIEKVMRLKPSEMDQAFFDGYFGPDAVKTEEEARTKIKGEITKYYDTQAKSYMYREIMEKLIDANDMPLPDVFLKRWLKTTNDKLTDEQLEKEFPDFLKNLKWTLIRTEIAKEEKIEVKPEEIQQNIVNQVRQYFGPYGMDNNYIDSTVQKLLQDRDQVNKVYEELLSEKVFQVIGERVKNNEKKISLEAFKDLVKEMNDKLNK